MDYMQSTTSSNNGFLSVKTVKGLEFIPYVEIIFIKADHKYTQIYLKNQLQPAKVFVSITFLDKVLPPDSFFRCHRSYIINMQHRRVLGKNRDILLTGNHTVPISDERMSEFINRTAKLG